MYHDHQVLLDVADNDSFRTCKDRGDVANSKLCILPHSDGSRRRGVLCLCTRVRVEGMGAGDAASSACVSMCGVTVGCQGIVKGVVDSSSVITTRSCSLLDDGQDRRERDARAS